MMESEKAEIAELAAKYGRVQSLMRYVNMSTRKHWPNPTAGSPKVRQWAWTALQKKPMEKT